MKHMIRSIAGTLMVLQATAGVGLAQQRQLLREAAARVTFQQPGTQKPNDSALLHHQFQTMRARVQQQSAAMATRVRHRRGHRGRRDGGLLRRQSHPAEADSRRGAGRVQARARREGGDPLLSGATWTPPTRYEMLVMPGGKERTEQEFRALFDRAGFTLTRIVPTKSPLSIVEARAKP